jgi:L-aspartate oxidase
MDHDVIVIGSGIAGLSFALKVAEAGFSVAILTKKSKAESNTNYAQGASQRHSQTDDVELHVTDTLKAGDGLCREDIVREMCGRVRRPSANGRGGVEFSQLDDGRVSLHREGGHSKRRILHVADVTGKAIEEALLHASPCSRRSPCWSTTCDRLITRRRLMRKGHDAPPAKTACWASTRSTSSRTRCAPSAPGRCCWRPAAWARSPVTTNPHRDGDGIAMAGAPASRSGT